MSTLTLPHPYLASLRSRYVQQEASTAAQLDAAQAQLDASMRDEWLACVIGVINLPRRRLQTERQLHRVERLERDLAELRSNLHTLDRELMLRAVG